MSRQEGPTPVGAVRRDHSVTPDETVDFAVGLHRHGSRTALVTEDGSMTYATLSRRVHEAAAWLGDERSLVLVVAAHAADTIVWYLAALSTGHPVLLAADDAHVSRLVDTYDPDVVIGPPGSCPTRRHRRSIHDLHPELALLLSTSGSTGSPKLVRLSHENLQSNATAIATYLGLTSEDRAITSLPLHYCYGLSVLHSHLTAGASIVLTDLSVLDPCFWDRVRTTGVTNLAGVPHTFHLLDRIGFDGFDLPRLRLITQAGGRLEADTVRRYAELGSRSGWDLYVMYGQTEATARMAYLDPSLAATAPGAIGAPIPGGELTIEPVDEGGPDGELVYRGPNVMLGYAHGPGDLASGRTVHELRTGDLARRGEDGLFEITGRRSRFVKLFGLRVDLDRLESLLADAGIAALCAGDDRGLAVAVEAPAEPDAVRGLVREQLGIPASAVRVTASTALPRLGSGKADYQAVLAAARTEAPARATTSAGDRSGRVRALFGNVLAVDRVRDDDTFVSLGGDSLAYVEMSVALEGLLGHLPDRWHVTPIDQLAATEPAARRLPRLETTIVLRAVAIVAIVANHAGAFHLPGGAHVLLAVAGFNFARFQIGAPRRWVAIGRVAGPAMAWIGVFAATSDDYGLTHALLVHSLIGDADARFSYWFIETLLLLLVAATLALSSARVRGLEARFPLGLPVAVAAFGLAIRHDVLDLPAQRYAVFRPQEVLWLFALGWAAARAETTRHRLLISTLTVVGIHGFFGDPGREVTVLVGTMLFLWIRTVPVTRKVQELVATTAGASLFIYLVHWQVLPHVEPLPAVVAVAACLAAGVACWRVTDAVTGQLAGRSLPRPDRASHSTAVASRARLVA